jgi:hypothetical protein
MHQQELKKKKATFLGLTMRDLRSTGARGSEEVMILRPSQPAIPTFQVVAMIAGGGPGTIRGHCLPETIRKEAWKLARDAPFFACLS